jgi:hypothetical protein
MSTPAVLRHVCGLEPAAVLCTLTRLLRFFVPVPLVLLLPCAPPQDRLSEEEEEEKEEEVDSEDEFDAAVDAALDPSASTAPLSSTSAHPKSTLELTHSSALRSPFSMAQTTAQSPTVTPSSKDLPSVLPDGEDLEAIHSDAVEESGSELEDEPEDEPKARPSASAGNILKLSSTFGETHRIAVPAEASSLANPLPRPRSPLSF